MLLSLPSSLQPLMSRSMPFIFPTPTPIILSQPVHMVEANKYRIFVALHSRSYPWNQRNEMGANFYHFDLFVESKGATDKSQVWNVYCASGVTADWRTHHELTRIADHPTLLVRVMVGKVTESRFYEAQKLILNAEKPCEGTNSASTWCRNAISALQKAGIVQNIDLDRLFEFTMRQADAREAKKKPRGGKVNFAKQLKFP